MNKIAIGSDHGGLELKNSILKYLNENNYEVIDCGTETDASVDYPDFGEKVAKMVSSGEADEGVLICGTGIGMSITANKFKGIRAALVHNEFTAKMAREHNNANILVLGGRVLSVEVGVKLVKIWQESSFEGGRHQGRLDKIHELEKQEKIK